jgi:hypothetical protein
MAAPTVDYTSEQAGVGEKEAVGSAAAWWYDWVDGHRVAAAALVGLIATQLGTYFGYVFPAFGLPTLPWPLYNGLLAVPAEEFGTTGSYFAGNSLHYLNGIVFAILYAVLALPIMPFRNTHGGNVARGVLYSVVLTVISLGILVPYAYVPKQGYGFFAFSGPDGWKLPFAVLVWHLIYGFFLGTLFQLRRERS